MVAVPSVIVPSLKVTEPDGEEPPESTAVRTTDWPAGAEVVELDSRIEGDAWPTVTAIAPDVAAELLLSPA